MALDAEFPTPQEEIDVYQQSLNGFKKSPPLSINFPKGNDIQLAETDFQPFQTPFTQIKDKAVEKESAGFFKQFGAVFGENEVITKNIVSQIDKQYMQSPISSNQPGQENPNDTSTPDEFNPYDFDELASVPEQYRQYLADSENPMQYEYRKREIANTVQKQEMIQNGSWLGWAAGHIAAFGVDAVATLFIPMAQSMKYATYGGAIFKNMIRQAPGIAAGSIAYTAADDAATTGKSMQDFYFDSFVNTLGGMALTGGAGGLGKALRGGELYEVSRRVFKGNIEGKEIRYKVNDKNIIEGYDVVDAATGRSVGAAQTKETLNALNSFYQKGGIFKLPFVGQGIEKALKISPTFRGLSSGWETSALVADLLADHSIITKGTQEGIARTQSFESRLRRVQTDAIEAGITLEGYRAAANGFEIGGDPISITKRLAQRMTQGVQYNKEAFSDAVTNVRITGEKHENTAINEAAEFLNKFYEKYLNEYQEAHGMEIGSWDVKTAANYLSRMYDVNYMLNNREQWVEMSVKWFQIRDNLINQMSMPLKQSKDNINFIKQNILNGINPDANRIALVAAKKEYAAIKNSLRDKIANNKSLLPYMEELPLSTKEAKELKKILKPLNEARKKLNQHKSKISIIDKKIRSLESKFTSGKKIINPEEKNYQAIKSELESAKKEKEALEALSFKLETDVAKLDVELFANAKAGNINRKFFYRNDETGDINLKKPTAAIKFQKTFESEDEMKEAAMGYFNSITSLDADKLANRMLKGVSDITHGNPMAERSFLIPDKELYDNKFLLKDISRNAALYALTLGRKTHLTNIFKNIHVSHSGMRGITERLITERAKKQAIIDKIQDKQKRDNAGSKLQKSFVKQKKYIESMIKVAEGKWGISAENETARAIARGSRAFVATTKLGNVPIAMIPDMAANVMKHGPWRTMRDFVFPSLKSINGLIKTKEAIHIKLNAERAGLALESVINSHSDSMFNTQVLSQMTVPGKVVGGLEYVAKLSGNLSLTNTFENMNQKWSASIAESRILEAMHKFDAGKLPLKDKRYLAQIGLDPEIWSKRFISSFKNSESFKTKLGAMRSQWWDWQDVAARNAMADAIRDSVYSSIVRRGMFDSPFIANDPMSSIFFNLTGWLFASMNRFTIPMLQNPTDSYLMVGLLAQIALGSLVDPLRRWSRGEEFNLDDDKWFVSAVLNTTPFASVYNTAMWANAITGDQFLSDLKNDRKRKLNISGAIAGPVGGSAQNLFETMRMFASGKFNKEDMKTFANTIPMTNLWYTNSFKNEMMDYLTAGLPKNYEKAPGYIK